MTELEALADYLAREERVGDALATTHLTICGTCADTRLSGEAGLGGGAKLMGFIKEQLAGHPFAPVIAVTPQRCLMACAEGCVASVSAQGKMQYLLGRLPATEDAAAMLLDFAAMHAAAPTGVTPNHEWPGTLALHFLGRIPPVDPAEGDWNEDGCNL